MKRLRLIYDCDNTMGRPWSEIDDGLTLLYLLGRPELELLGVTTTFGNGPLDDVQRCTERLVAELGLTGRLPVLRGAARAGDHDTEAARFLAETIAAAPGEIAVLATGPLGNLAAAATRDPQFFAQTRRIDCMGGLLRQPFRVGRRVLGELNLSADAAASHAVLTRAPRQTTVTLYSAHVCLQAPFELAQLLALHGLVRTGRWKPMWFRLVRDWWLKFGVSCAQPCFYLWDLLPAVGLSAPELFAGSRVSCTSSEAALAEGLVQLQGDPIGASEGAALCLPTFLRDKERFYALLFEAWAEAGA